MTVRADKTILVSVDVETDGPIPGDYSMLSLGAYAFSKDGTEHGTFYITLGELPGAKQDPDTMLWWLGREEAWEMARKGAIKPIAAMKAFNQFLTALPGKPIFVGYPATFDFGFTHFYFEHFGIRDPFSFSAIDLKTYAYCLLDIPFNQMVKRNMPSEWFDENKHSHHALSDAIEQGKIFLKMMEFRRELLYNKGVKGAENVPAI